MSARKKDSKIEFTSTSGEKLWFDLELYKADLAYRDQKEKEYWDYCISGQRTLDLFGEEGAKWVLEEQDRRDREARNDNTDTTRDS